jgi:hypothetical protein
MGTNVRTYILIGTAVGPDWGKLPTDGQGDQDAYDDWNDRHGDLEIYEPKRDDIVYFNDMDGAHYGYLGRVVDHFNDKWDRAEFNETFDVERLTREIAEVAAILLEKYGVTSKVALHIISNCC